MLRQVGKGKPVGAERALNPRSRNRVHWGEKHIDAFDGYVFNSVVPLHEVTTSSLIFVLDPISAL
jgi:hypothetical protein